MNTVRYDECSVLRRGQHINRSVFGDSFDTVLLLSYRAAARRGSTLLATVVAGYETKQLQASVLPVKQMAYFPHSEGLNCWKKEKKKWCLLCARHVTIEMR